MKKTRTTQVIFPVLLIAGIGIWAALFTYVRMQETCEEVQCISIPLLESKTGVEVSEKTKISYLALYTLPSQFIRVERRSDISNEDAETLTKVTVMRMQGQFETARSPYPGILSDAITCDSKFDIHPQSIQNGTQSLMFFTGYLNNRKQYGSCLDSEIQYTGLNVILYCDSHDSWYRIEALIPTKSGEDVTSITNQFKQISCR